MLKQNLRFRPVLVLMLGLSLLCLGTSVRADDHRQDRQGDQRDNRNDHGNRYHYREGHWYGQGDVLFDGLAVGAIVESVPPQGRIVVVGDRRYYYDNTRYYSQEPDGSYVVVEAPTTVVVEQPSSPLIQVRL